MALFSGLCGPNFLSLDHNSSVVAFGINSDVFAQSFNLFGRAPRFSEEAVNICSQHRARMVERKERIESSAFQLSLSNNASSAPRKSLVNGVWEKFRHIRSVVRIRVGFNECLGRNVVFEIMKELVPGLLSAVFPIAIFFYGTPY